MLGPNGVGKSTIFNLITGLISPKSGKIKINGEDVTEYPIYLRSKKFRLAMFLNMEVFLMNLRFMTI
jgi:lipopolysaccharide export system ATP-binding protein